MTPPVLIFDGDCAFCTSCVQFARRVLPDRVSWVPWQFADLDMLGVTEESARESVQWVGESAQKASGPVAIAEVLRASGGVWALLGGLLRARPVLWIAWPAYRWVARNRHRLPGGTAACALPVRPI